MGDQRLRWTGRSALVAAAASVLVAGAFLLWPLHATGVSGTARTPHFHEFSFSTLEPLPTRPTEADLRRIGVRLPQDAVADRRRDAYLALGCGLAVTATLAVVAIWGRRRRLEPGDR